MDVLSGGVSGCLCVAVTRARRHVAIVGDSVTVGSDPFLRRLLARSSIHLVHWSVHLVHSSGPLVRSFGPFIWSIGPFLGPFIWSIGPFIWSIHLVHSFGPFIWSIHLVHSFGPFKHIGPFVGPLVRVLFARLNRGARFLNPNCDDGVYVLTRALYNHGQTFVVYQYTMQMWCV